MKWRSFLTLSLIVLTTILFSSMGFADEFSYTGKISSQGVESIGYIAFEIDSTAGQITPQIANEVTLTEEAINCLEIVPEWLKADLRDSLSRIPATQHSRVAEIILGVEDPRIIDEVAFVFAHMGPEMIDYAFSRGFLQVVVENAEWLYSLDEQLDYVQIIDVGSDTSEDGYYSTASYTIIDEEGSETEYTLPREIYYWYIVHPILDCQEQLRKVEPTRGFPSTSGFFWREFYYQDSPDQLYQRPYLLRHPNDITTVELSSMDFAGASAYSYFIGPERSYGSVIRQSGTLAPVFISFVHGDGRCCNNNYPNPDGHVFATTIPLEYPAENGDNRLLKNVVLAGQGNMALRKNMLMSQNFADVSDRKILIIRDRIPFDGDVDPNELILTAHAFDYDVIPSSSLNSLELVTDTAPYVPSEYIKIIVPSDQPIELYQALADNRDKIEQFVDYGGVFELHGATRPADDWSDIELPFGIRCAPMDGSNYISSIETGGFPLLKEVIENTRYLWNRQMVNLPGERAYDPSEGAIAKIGWWVANNLPWNVAEMATWQRTVAPRRAVDPVKILYNHYGNCGEIQDVLAAAARTLLIPCSLTATFADDHVWNEFYDNDRWHPYQVSWSGSTTHIDNWSIAYDADTGGSKTISGMIVSRPDCYIYNILGRYSPTVNDEGIIEAGDYSFYITLRITVTDPLGNPVDGARILIATPSFYDPDALTIATWAFTDSSGVAEFTVGEGNAYYWQISSPLGYLPDPDHVQLLATEDQTAEPGTVIEKTLGYEGTTSVPSVEVRKAEYIPPAPDQEAITIHVNATAGRELQYGGNFAMAEKSFTQPLNTATFDIYVMDEQNYTNFTSALSASAIEIYPAQQENDFTVEIPLNSGNWYVVFANQARVTNAQEISLTVSTSYRPPAEQPLEQIEQVESLDEPLGEQEDIGISEAIDGGSDAEQEQKPEEGRGCSCNII